jgi:hypothetical protein
MSKALFGLSRGHSRAARPTGLTHPWQCSLRLHPGAGHDLPLDDTPWVLEQIQHWRAAWPMDQPGALHLP